MSAINHPPPGPVVVGVDGSDSSLYAVDLAAREAQLRHRPLHIVHAFIWPYFDVPLESSPYAPPGGGLRHDAERILVHATARAQAAASGITVTGEITTGAPAPVLLGHARAAALLVVGDRGLGGFSGLLIGSVAVQLATHATCPILIARGRTDPTRPILLGVDGSPANDAAVGYAFEAAALHGVPLIALHAWTGPVSTGPGDMLPLVYDQAEVEAEETRILAEALAGWKTKYPDVTVHRTVEHAGPRKALIAGSQQAQLVVVGTRGHGGFTGLLIGSVSQALIHHAACPVTVIAAHR